MKIFIFFMLLSISSCVSTKYSYDYFVDCEKNFNEFNSLSSCAFEKIERECEDFSNCELKNKRFVEIIKRLKLMVDKNEISENEAMFRYLNLIDLEEKKLRVYRNDYYNQYYPPYINNNYSRSLLPFYFRNGYFY